MSRDPRAKAVVGQSRVTTYVTVSAAVLTLADRAKAVITHVPVNVHLQDTTTDGTSVDLDLHFGAVPHHLTFSHGVFTSNAADGYAVTDSDFLGSPGVDGVAGFHPNNYNYMTKVPYNAAISAQTFLTAAQAAQFVYLASNAGFPNSQFTAAGIGFVGVKFNTNQYGWVRVNMDGVPLNSFTVVDYAYAGPGEPIRAGQVPEPSSLAMLALGAIGIAQWRGARKKMSA
jgi:PEP-CTERM motif